MALKYETNQYTIPRGRVFFDPWDTNGSPTGERYLGNCPSVSLTISSEKSDHYSSTGGLRQKDLSVPIQIERTGTITCDNLSDSNLALFVAGGFETVTQSSGTDTEETLTVTKGRYYQIGKTESNPAGVRNLSALAVTNTAETTTYAAGTDYEVDLVLGRLQILDTGTIANGAIKLTYSAPAKTWTRVKTGSSGELNGSLRIIADNATGANRDYYMPYVSLAPDGELPIIQDGTDVVTASFALEVLKPENAEAIYIDGRPAA